MCLPSLLLAGYSFSYLSSLLLLHVSPPLSPHIPPSLQFNYSLASFSPPPSYCLGPSDLWRLGGEAGWPGAGRELLQPGMYPSGGGQAQPE